MLKFIIDSAFGYFIFIISYYHELIKKYCSFPYVALSEGCALCTTMADVVKLVWKAHNYGVEGLPSYAFVKNFRLSNKNIEELINYYYIDSEEEAFS